MTARLLAGFLIFFGGCTSLMSCTLSCNPMGWGFQTEFTVENAGDETIHVTPIGVHESKVRCALPVAHVSIPTVHAIDRGHIPVPPGQSVKVRYDWDDINLSEIAVEGPGGEWRQHVVLPDAKTIACCKEPEQRHIVVAPFAELAPIDDEVKKAAIETRKNPRMAVLYVAYLGPLLLWLGIWIRRRSGKAEDA